MRNIAIVGRDLILAPTMFSIVLRSITATIIGICLIINPLLTIKYLTYLVGVIVLMLGVTGLMASGRTAPGLLRRSLQVIAGTIAAVGLFMVFFPSAADFIVLVLFAFITLSSGIQQLAGAGESGNRQFFVFSGLLSLLLGILIIVAPEGFMTGIGLVAGIYLVCFGMFTFAWALAQRGKK
ncbi:MAG: DUF308 domain-containing protein [Victivallaceae bacterium]